MKNIKHNSYILIRCYIIGLIVTAEPNPVNWAIWMRAIAAFMVIIGFEHDDGSSVIDKAIENMMVKAGQQKPNSPSDN